MNDELNRLYDSLAVGGVTDELEPDLVNTEPPQDFDVRGEFQIPGSAAEAMGLQPQAPLPEAPPLLEEPLPAEEQLPAEEPLEPGIGNAFRDIFEQNAADAREARRGVFGMGFDEPVSAASPEQPAPELVPEENLADSIGLENQTRTLNRAKEFAEEGADATLRADLEANEVEANVSAAVAEAEGRYAESRNAANNDYQNQLANKRAMIENAPLLSPGQSILAMIAGGIGGALEVTSQGKVKNDIPTILNNLARKKAAQNTEALKELRLSLGDDISALDVAHASVLKKAIAEGDSMMKGVKDVRAGGRWQTQRAGIEQNVAQLQGQTYDRAQRTLNNNRNFKLKEAETFAKVQLSNAKAAKANRRGTGKGKVLDETTTHLIPATGRIVGANGKPRLDANGNAIRGIPKNRFTTKEVGEVRAKMGQVQNRHDAWATVLEIGADRNFMQTLMDNPSTPEAARVQQLVQSVVNKAIQAEAGAQTDSDVVRQYSEIVAQKPAAFFSWLGKEGTHQQMRDNMRDDLRKFNTEYEVEGFVWEGPQGRVSPFDRKGPEPTVTVDDVVAEVDQSTPEEAGAVAGRQAGALLRNKDSRTADADQKKLRKSLASKLNEVDSALNRLVPQQYGNPRETESGLREEGRAAKAEGNREEANRLFDQADRIKNLLTQRVTTQASLVALDPLASRKPQPVKLTK